MKLLLLLAQLGRDVPRKLWVRLITLRWNIYADSYEKAVQKAMYPDGELREVGKTLNACFVAIKNSHLDLERVSVLDAGCGTGFLSSAIPNPRYLVGVDISKRMIKNLRERKVGGVPSTMTNYTNKKLTSISAVVNQPFTSLLRARRSNFSPR